MRKYYIGLLMLGFLLSFKAEAQQVKLNADSIFFSARSYALNKNYKKAREKCNEILLSFPDYYDARVLKGRTFAWQHQYDSARFEINKVLEKVNYSDAIDAIIDVENWSGNNKKALEYCDRGINNFPQTLGFRLKRSKLLIQENDGQAAQREILHILEIDPKNKDARDLLQKVRKITIPNKISIQHSYEQYTEPWTRKWQMVNVDYRRQTKLGSIIGRVYMGDLILEGEKLFEKNVAVQYELEAYPAISDENYLYLDYGYSNGRLFPQNRFGIEYYQKVRHTFELSAGIRFLQFAAGDGPGKKILIYTGTVGKYFRNYWFSFRPYLSERSNGLSQSYYITTRRYLSTRDNYISLELGKGSSPDEPLDYAENFDNYKLNMNKVQLSWQQLFFDRLIFTVLGAYQLEEYQADQFRNNVAFKLQLGYNF